MFSTNDIPFGSGDCLGEIIFYKRIYLYLSI